MAYCQLIRTPNRMKWLEYARRVLESGDTFDNVIFSDEFCFPSAVPLYLLQEDRRADEVQTKTEASN